MAPPDALDLTLDELIAHDLFVRRLARTLTANAAAADDVAQDAWFAAMKKPPRPGSNLRAWLAGVVRRLAWKAHRSDMRRGRREERAARQETDGSSAAEVVAAESTRAALVAAVMRLDEPYRESVLLRYFKAMEPTEIARRTGVPAGTVRHRIFVALGRLRVDLDAAHDGSRDRWLAALTPLGAPAFLGASVGVGVAEGVGAASGLGATSTATTSAGTSAGGAIGGALIMTTKAKLTTLLSALILAALAWRSWHVGAPEREPANHSAPTVNAALEQDLASSRTTASTPIAPSGAGAAAIVGKPFESEPRAQPNAFGSLRISTTRNGAPCGGVALKILEWGGPDPFLQSVRAVTDLDGGVLISRVRAGAVAVVADVGPSASATVRPGSETAIEVRLDGGFSIVGRVVDAEQRPIAGASVSIGQADSEFLDPPSARCDGSGRFRLDGVSERFHVAARAPGYSPSTLIPVAGGEGDQVETTIQLSGRGGLVRGRCLLPDGSPAVGARVRAAVVATASTAGASPPSLPAMARTDGEGRFLFAGSAPGPLRLSARTAETAMLHRDITVEEGAEFEVELRLTEGVTLEGVISLPDGNPAIAAGVAIGSYASFDSSLASTDSDGFYRLTGLSPGGFAVKASLDGVGRAGAAFVATADGKTIRWDATLSVGAVLKVRVVDESGAPLVGTPVEAHHERGFSPSSEGASYAFSRTDIEGRVIFIGLARGAFTLRALDSALGPHALATAKGSTDGPEVVITIPRAGLVSGFVVGRLVDGDGAPIASAELHARCDGSGRMSSAYSDKDGRFKLGPLPAGRVRATFTVAKFGRGGLGAREMAVGETWDLGDVRLQAPGVLIVRVASQTASDRSNLPCVSVRSETGDFDETGETSDGIASIALAPGRYFVAVVGWSTDRADIEVTVEIESGATTTVDLAPPKGAPVQVRLKSAMPRVGEVVADVDVFDSSGRLTCRRRAASRHSGGERFDDVGLRLAPGSYVVRASSPGGRGEAVIEVTSADVDATSAVDLARPPLVIELR